MSYTDADVEEIINAYFVAYDTSKNARGQTADAVTIHSKAHEQGVRAARAALEAIEREPLEDVLRGGAKGGMVVQWVGPIATNKYWALVAAWDDSDREMRFDATGATIDEAIRAALAAAKEGAS